MRGLALSAAFAVFAFAAFAEGQITIVNSRNKTDFKRYSLQVNPFEFKAGHSHSDNDVLRVCESLDNSRLAILGHGGEKCFAETTRFLFGTKAVATSLDGFFRRGGMLYVEPGSWGVYNSWAPEARRFFADRGVVVPTGGDYKDPNAGKGDRVVVGKLQDGPGQRVFGGPASPESLYAVRYFDGAATANAKAYVATDAGEVLMMGRRVEKGAVVFSLVISVMDRASSPFWDNCVASLYGKSAAQKHAGRSVYIASARKRGLSGLYVREVPVFGRLMADSLPPDGSRELEKISMLLARGDRELARIAFYNCTDENYVFRLEPSPSRRNRDIFTFLDVVPWRTPSGQVLHEIVSSLGSSGTVSVPSGETKTVLLAAETDRLPGKYEWSFEIVPVNADIPTRKVSVSAEVLDLAVCGECLPLSYMFGPYNTGAAVGRIGAYRSFLVDRNRVTHVLAGVSPWGRLLAKGPDGVVRVDEKAWISVSDELFEKAHGRRWVCGYGQLYSFRAAMKRLGAPADLSNPQTLELFRRGVARIDAAYREAGIDPGSDFFESLIDEPNAKDVPDVLAAAEVVHSFGWRVCIDIATWCTLDDVRRLAPAVDWWQPWERRLENRADSAEEAAFYRSTGKLVTPYLCSMSGNTDPYLSYHRLRGVRAFWRGYDGFCTWAANSWRGNDYRGRDNDLDGSSGSFPGSWYVQHGDDAPVGTMRLEAWREGAEDFHWLKVAEKLGAAQEYRSPERLKAVDAASDPVAAKEWRDGLLRSLARSRPAASRGRELFNGRDLSGWYTFLRGRGRNSDPKGVFTVKDGVIRVSGEEFGCITTEEEFSDYRLTVEYRWLGTRFGGKRDKALDSGILFHSVGEDGGFAGVWMRSFEYNLITGASGDFWTVYPRDEKSAFLKARVGLERLGGRYAIHQKDGEEITVTGNGRVCRSDIDLSWSDTPAAPLAVNENPTGEWNTAVLECRGDAATCYFNGKLVNRATHVNPARGRIQLQSEGCGIEFRRVFIESLAAP